MANRVLFPLFLPLSLPAYLDPSTLVLTQAKIACCLLTLPAFSKMGVHASDMAIQQTHHPNQHRVYKDFKRSMKVLQRKTLASLVSAPNT
jgi:hypothetical protein